MKIKRTWQLSMLPLLTHALLFLRSSSQSTNNESANGGDLLVLLSFKSLITNDPTRALSSWVAVRNGTGTPAPDFCRWPGVACSDRHHPVRVSAIRLGGFGMVGTISPQLGNLTRLRVLDLSANSLEGEIPFSLGDCAALYAMNLSVNHLSGSIPAPLGRLSKLTFFNVSQNGLTGDIPISLSNLTVLRNLSIESNNFHGQIPSWLGNLTSLTHLNLRQNGFSGNIPATLGKITNLSHFDVLDNKLEGLFPPSIFNISSMRILNFGMNQLSGSLPLDIGFKLPKLKLLSTFANNQFGGPLPSSLANASKLEYLVLRGNRHHGLIPRDICIHGRLRTLALGYNDLHATEPSDWDFLTSLTNCSNLEFLDLERNHLVGSMPVSIANLSKEITWILLSKNQISGTLPAEIGIFHKLLGLKLADNLFKGTLPRDIGWLSNLNYFDLSHNRFDGQIPPSMGNITQLNNLYLSNNFLEGSIPASLGNLTNIASMDLSYNSFRGQIPEEILSISSLTIFLNLSNNVLSGSISTQIWHLKNLGIIDLSMNKLSGEIPEALGGCVLLSFLYLQGNNLQGQIPKSLLNLRALESLDLSYNNLTGSIPEFLGSFKFLKYLNLSFNHLSGPVPNTGIFCNATTLSLTGNSMLCGGPPFLQLPPCPSVGSHQASQHRLHVIIFCIIGTLIFFMCSITSYFFIKKKIKQNFVDHESLFLNEKHERISYAELQEATESFSPANLIGSGSFGDVYKGTLILDENIVPIAIKVLNLSQRGAGRSFLTECDALRRIRHWKLVKVITVCDGLDHNGDEFKALVFEFICNGSLHEWLHTNTTTSNMTFRRLSLVKRLYIALDVAEALEYLHNNIEPPIVHCDIKPSNILLDDDIAAHVTDFGLAKSTAQDLKSPPMVSGDIYSYGVLLLEMFTGRRPTDSFIDGVTSLVNYVKMAYPNNLLEILDVSATYSGNTQDIIDIFICPIFKLGLACCENSPRQRMKIDDVVEELNAIKKACIAHMPRS